MAAPKFPVNAHRHDPYRNFKFQILIDGQPVAGLNKVSALHKVTEVIAYREGGDPASSRKLPGRTEYMPITLEQGVSHDPVFERWANLANNLDGDSAMSLVNFRKDIVLNLLNLQGVVSKAYIIRRCWVSEYVALPDLDANQSAVAIEKIVIQNEGWERDDAVSEPVES